MFLFSLLLARGGVRCDYAVVVDAVLFVSSSFLVSLLSSLPFSIFFFLVILSCLLFPLLSPVRIPIS